MKSNIILYGNLLAELKKNNVPVWKGQWQNTVLSAYLEQLAALIYNDGNTKYLVPTKIKLFDAAETELFYDVFSSSNISGSTITIVNYFSETQANPGDGEIELIEYWCSEDTPATQQFSSVACSIPKTSDMTLTIQYKIQPTATGG